MHMCVSVLESVRVCVCASVSKCVCVLGFLAGCAPDAQLLLCSSILNG